MDFVVGLAGFLFVGLAWLSVWLVLELESTSKFPLVLLGSARFSKRLRGAVAVWRGVGRRRSRFHFSPQPQKIFLDSWSAWVYLAFVIRGLQVRIAS